MNLDKCQGLIFGEYPLNCDLFTVPNHGYTYLPNNSYMDLMTTVVVLGTVMTLYQ